MDTNLQFISIRKFANLEWETYQDRLDKTYLALCHKTTDSVRSDSWDGLWDEIIKASKVFAKRQKKRGLG